MTSDDLPNPSMPEPRDQGDEQPDRALGDDAEAANAAALDRAEATRGEDRRRLAIFGIVGSFLAILLIVVAVQWATDSDDSAEDVLSLPPVTLTTLDGEEFQLTAIVGQPTVVNFFASWCSPCRAELPEFQEVSVEVAGSVDFIGINTRETDVDGAATLIAEAGVTYTVLVGDEGEVFEAIGGLGMPTTAFVNAAGEVVEVHSGILTAGDLRAKISEHFG